MKILFPLFVSAMMSAATHSGFTESYWAAPAPSATVAASIDEPHRDVEVRPNQRTKVEVWVNAVNKQRAVVEFSDGRRILDVQGSGDGADYPIGDSGYFSTSNNQYVIRVWLYYQKDGAGPWIPLKPYVFREDSDSYPDWVILASSEPGSPDEDCKVKISQVSN